MINFNFFEIREKIFQFKKEISQNKEKFWIWFDQLEKRYRRYVHRKHMEEDKVYAIIYWVNYHYYKKYAHQNLAKINYLWPHPWHLVSPSPWPLLMSVSAFNFAVGFVCYLHIYDIRMLMFGISNIIIVLVFWWRDVISEAVYDGEHTEPVQKNIKFGVVLFIVSEVMFFFGFFWAYFHSSLSPSIFIGAVWPPYGITPINYLGIPFYNTLILLASGVTLTSCHFFMINREAWGVVIWFIVTLFLAIKFILEQFYEYLYSPFSINDSIYGTCFYMLTGFHGFHVIVGAIFIFVCFIRYLLSHFTPNHHVGFESSAWYWHFVDVVWLGLYISVYYWGS